MASPSELSLDCKPHSYLMLKSFGGDQTHKLEEFLSRLEEERLKIDAFKRELPLCMQLLTNAVEASRQQLQASRGNQGGSRPTLEEFIPIKNVDKASSISSDMATWMTTAQLWSQADNNETKTDNTTNVPLTKESDVIGFNVRNGGGGAFLPFSKEKNNPIPSPTTLVLSTVDMEDKKCSEGTRENGVKRDQEPSGLTIDRQGHEAANISPADGQAGNIVNSNTSTNNSNGGNGHRKARRCWSPDLHRRFVNSLQMLGGSQVATPKQIRELMKVDGLTNDEVKSHLQKYRLHTRRPSPSPQVPGAPTPQLVVLGSIWVPPEYAGGAPTLYGAHHHHPATSHSVPPPHFCAPTPPVTQEFYAVAAPPHLPMQAHRVYKTALQNDHHLSSPESDNRGNGDRSESIEDGKSDQSGSWKVESGERRGLAALREDGEESNGTEITPKF